MLPARAHWRNRRRVRRRTSGRSHYNYFRDYDPATGRYVESDPIGLNGGINTYSYALENPNLYVDPKGQEAVAWLIHYTSQSRKTQGCKSLLCQGSDRVTVSTGGSCAPEDVGCENAQRAGGLPGPYVRQYGTYSISCLLALGVVGKTAGFKGSQYAVKNAAAAASWAGAGEAVSAWAGRVASWALGEWSLLFWVPEGFKELAEKCRCQDGN